VAISILLYSGLVLLALGSVSLVRPLSLLGIATRLHALIAFDALTLGRVRHFARAAEALHVARPSLSRNIAALEKTIGVPLFDRGKGDVQPTAIVGRLALTA
jgi:hypothetical protein